MKIFKISLNTYQIEKENGMMVDCLFFANKKIYDHILNDNSLNQLINVAKLPGVVKYAIGMPDIHYGYGFPIGGVAAFDIKNGVVSPGGVGYDINCGVRFINTDLNYEKAKIMIDKLINEIYKNVPVGVGVRSKKALSKKEFNRAIIYGAQWAIDKGFGSDDEINHIEGNGNIRVEELNYSKRSFERSIDELGTLGSGNHFIEIQRVDEIFDEELGNLWGIKKNTIAIMIHTGSRGFGHQLCSDSLSEIRNTNKKYGFTIPDRELSAIPIESREGKIYLNRMAMAANFAYANRQIIDHLVRRSIRTIFPNCKFNLLYDVCHNIARFEEHIVNGKKKNLLVHRKGATRSLGKDNKLLNEKFIGTGQPVITPGDFGSASYIMVGTKKAEEISFSSTSHGAGRLMSRRKALKTGNYNDLINYLQNQHIAVRSFSKRTLLEERPGMYKNIEDIVETIETVGIAKKIARVIPLGVIKG